VFHLRHSCFLALGDEILVGFVDIPVVGPKVSRLRKSKLSWAGKKDLNLWNLTSSCTHLFEIGHLLFLFRHNGIGVLFQHRGVSYFLYARVVSLRKRMLP